MVSCRSGKITTSQMLDEIPVPRVFIRLPLLLLANSLLDLIPMESKGPPQVDASGFAWFSFVELAIEECPSSFCVWVLLIVGKSVYYPDLPVGCRYTRLPRIQEMISRGNVYWAVISDRKSLETSAKAGNMLLNGHGKRLIVVQCRR